MATSMLGNSRLSHLRNALAILDSTLRSSSRHQRWTSFAFGSLGNFGSPPLWWKTVGQTLLSALICAVRRQTRVFAPPSWRRSETSYYEDPITIASGCANL